MCRRVLFVCAIVLYSGRSLSMGLPKGKASEQALEHAMRRAHPLVPEGLGQALKDAFAPKK